MALSKINLGRAAENDTITSAKIGNDITNNDINASAAIDVSKANLMSSTDKTRIEQNIALLGFKMAVTESLTVFNLVDGVVDEFHDESGTDEGEGSNDNYCATGDSYNNTTCTPISAGFIAAFLAGLVACNWMIALVKKSKLSYFSIYCAIVGLIAIGYSLLS